MEDDSGLVEIADVQGDTVMPGEVGRVGWLSESGHLSPEMVLPLQVSSFLRSRNKNTTKNLKTY